MLFLTVQKKYKNSLTNQIYGQIRNMILKGDLKAHEKLSSTRELASLLNVSRNTIMVAYDMLIAEGYLKSIPGSGIYVAQGAQFQMPYIGIKDYNLTPYTSDKLTPSTIDFHSGTPALEYFPRSKWNRIASKVFNEAPVSILGYDYPQGRPELRETLSVYLKKTRGIKCHPDQIIITTGAKQALSLVAKCLLKQESNVWIEDPTNDNVRKIFSYHTGRLTPIPVGKDGIQLESLPNNCKPDLIFVTPSHQFPMGGILPIQKRIELIRFARKCGCYIIEDDYDNEFRYDRPPVSSLQELDNEKIIYISSFSKALFPSLRLGFVVLPSPIIKQCKEWKRLGDHHSNSINQLILMRLIETGELERHIARMKKIYRKRRDLLITCLGEMFSDSVTISGETSGLHIVADFSGISFTPDVIKKISQAGVNVLSIEELAMIKGNHCSQVILGYSHLNESQIREGVSRLKECLRKIKTGT